MKIHYMNQNDNAFTKLPPVRDVFINPYREIMIPEIDPSGTIKWQKIPFSIVLWHETIGHGFLGYDHPRSRENFHLTYFPGYVDPVIAIENLARNCVRLLEKRYDGFLFWGWRTIWNRVPWYHE